MLRDVRSSLEARAGGAALGLLLLIAGAGTSSAQKDASSPPPQGSESTPAELRGGWLEVPINTFVPGAVSISPKVPPPIRLPRNAA